jgi:signal transduction histidine kinase
MKDKGVTIHTFHKTIHHFWLTFYDSLLEEDFANNRFNHLREVKAFGIAFVFLVIIITLRKIGVLFLIVFDIDNVSSSLLAAILNLSLIPVVLAIEIIVGYVRRLRILRGFASMTYIFLSINYSTYLNDPVEFRDNSSSIPLVIAALVIGITLPRTWTMAALACAAGGVTKVLFQHLGQGIYYEKIAFDIIYIAAYILAALCLTFNTELFKQSYYEMLNNLPLSLILLDSENNPLVCNNEVQKILGSSISISREVLENDYYTSGTMQSSRDAMMNFLSELIDPDSGFNLKLAVENWNSEKLEAAPKYEFRKEGEERMITARGLRGLFGTINCKILILQDQTSFYSLEALNTKYQKLYLASIVHDIRTPLNGIVGMLEMINLEEIVEENKKYLDSAKQMCRLMTYLTYDIIDFSLLESNRFKSNISQVNLINVAEEVKDMFASNFKKKNIDYNFVISMDVPQFVFIDKNRYIQILINLLGNALKYTFKGHVKVYLNYDKESDLLVTKVEDAGVGINEADFPKLFKLFGKLHANVEHSTPGVGFGLVICKKLAESMQGSITVKSTEGHGSTFTFTVRANMENMVEDNSCASLANEMATHYMSNELNEKINNYKGITIASTVTRNPLTTLNKNKRNDKDGLEREDSKGEPEGGSIFNIRDKETVHPKFIRQYQNAVRIVSNLDFDKPRKCCCKQILLVDDNACNLFVLQSYIRTLNTSADEAPNDNSSKERK